MKIAKVALNLWRYRAGNLPTKDRLIRRGMVINGTCELCGKELETADHIFLKCDYTRWILREGLEAAESLVSLDSVGNFDEATTELNKVAPGTSAWGLQWTMFGAIVFQVWKQRNQKRMENKLDPKQVALRACIDIVGTGFDDRSYKRRQRSPDEKRALLQWDALLMLIHAGDG